MWRLCVRRASRGILSVRAIRPAQTARGFEMANYIVLDCETTDKTPRVSDRAQPENSLVYDLGWVIYDNKTGEVLRERSFVIAETFYDNRRMQSAYYASKLPQYHEGIKRGEWVVAGFREVWQTLRADCKEFGVSKAWAYNCQFDEKALNSTLDHYSNGYNHWFMPYKLRLNDIWDYCSNITSTTAYLKFCDKNGYFTPKGNPITNAETVYRFISGARDFVEDHTALSDARIEMEILKAARKKHSKTRHSRGRGWMDAAKANKGRR